MKELIAKARAKAAAASERQKTLAALIEAENREFTEAEQADFDAASATIERAAADIAKWQKTLDASAQIERSGADAERAAGTAEVPAVIRAVTAGEGGTREPAARVEIARSSTPLDACSKAERERREKAATEEVGLFAQAVGLSKFSENDRFRGRKALEILADMGYPGLADLSTKIEREYRENVAKATGLTVERVFSLATANTAGNLTFTPLSPDYIEMLRNRSIFLRGGPRVIDMPLGTLKIPAGNTPAVGSYTALGSDYPYSEMTTRAVNMSAKHLRTLTAYDNYSAETSPLAIASIVGDDLAQVLTLTKDSAGLRGDGTGNNPSGVYTLVGAGQRVAATATSVTPTYAECDADARIMLAKYRVSNVPQLKPTWLMSNRVFTYLQFLRNSFGEFVYAGLQNVNPTWAGGFPVLVSEQIPSNLGVGTNESELYLCDFGHVLVGETKALMLEASREASYINASAATVSAFSRNETVIRGTAAHDFAVRHIKSSVVLTAVKWGA